MKSGSAAAGTVSGCLVWLIVLIILLTCLAPAGFLFALFTSTSDFAAGLVGPLVCPAGSSAQIERLPTTYVDADGFTREAMGAEMVCSDDQGRVVTRPAPLPNWIWAGLVGLASLALAGGLAAVLVVLAGVVMARLTGRRKTL